jgi:hypothetical protein
MTTPPRRFWRWYASLLTLRRSRYSARPLPARSEHLHRQHGARACRPCQASIDLVDTILSGVVEKVNYGELAREPPACTFTWQTWCGARRRCRTVLHWRRWPLLLNWLPEPASTQLNNSIANTDFPPQQH